MKKYNLSKIMKRAWELVKTAAMTISAALKKAWSEAKAPATVKMCVCGKESFAVDTRTGVVSGKTYNSRQFLKDNFMAAWDGSKWTVDVDKFNAELANYPDYYKKYIVTGAAAPKAGSNDSRISYQKLVNRNDGFYNYIEYTDGSSAYVFVG